MKNWSFPTLVLEKSLYSPSDSKEIKPVTSKENQPWIFIGKTDGEAEAPILWSPDAKSWLIGKGPDAGKTEGRGRKEQKSMKWMDYITDSVAMALSKLWEAVKDSEAWVAAVQGFSKI